MMRRWRSLRRACGIAGALCLAWRPDAAAAGERELRVDFTGGMEIESAAPSAPEPEAARPSHDTLVRLQRGRLRIAGRHRAPQAADTADWRAFGELRLGSGGRIVLGHWDGIWGGGGLLAESGSRARSGPRADLGAGGGVREIPGRIRGSTSVGARARAGAAVLVSSPGRLWGAWAHEGQLGCGGGMGPVGVAVVREARGDSTSWGGSLLLTSGRTRRRHQTTPGGGDQAEFLLEVAARWRRGRVSGGRIDGGWVLDVGHGLGCMEGEISWSFTRPGFSPAGDAAAFASLAARPAHDYWSLEWAAPLSRGLAPRVALLVGRRLTQGDPVPPLEWASHLALTFEPWAGARLHALLGGEEVRRCRRDPSGQDRGVFVRDGRSTLDLRADVLLSPGVELRLRHRRTQAAVSVASEDLPLGLGPRELADPEAAPADTALGQWWDRGSGGVSSVGLCWRAARGLRAGALLAATPRRSESGAMVPLRRPPGRTVWRTLGRGSWLAGGWAAVSVCGAELEGAVHLINAGGGGRRDVVLIQLGFSRRFRE